MKTACDSCSREIGVSNRLQFIPRGPIVRFSEYKLCDACFTTVPRMIAVMLGRPPEPWDT